MLLCIFLCSMQVTVSAASYILSGNGFYTSNIYIRNNLPSSYSSHLSPSINAWNYATSKVNISTSSVSESYINALTLSDSVYGLNGISSSYFFILINSNKCTSSNTQSVIVHEFGHVFNLADNNNLALSIVPIMSNYRDRTVVKTPTSIDIEGVNASYNNSYMKN